MASVLGLLAALRALGPGFLGALYYKSNWVTLLKCSATAAAEALLQDLTARELLSTYSSPALARRTAAHRTTLELYSRHVILDPAGGAARQYDGSQPLRDIAPRAICVAVLDAPTPASLWDPQPMEEVEVEVQQELLPPQDVGVVEFVLPGGRVERRALGPQADGSCLLLRRYRACTHVYLAPATGRG